MFNEAVTKIRCAQKIDQGTKAHCTLLLSLEIRQKRSNIGTNKY